LPSEKKKLEKITGSIPKKNMKVSSSLHKTLTLSINVEGPDLHILADKVKAEVQSMMQWRLSRRTCRGCGKESWGSCDTCPPTSPQYSPPSPPSTFCPPTSPQKSPPAARKRELHPFSLLSREERNLRREKARNERRARGVKRAQYKDVPPIKKKKKRIDKDADEEDSEEEYDEDRDGPAGPLLPKEFQATPPSVPWSLADPFNTGK
jgi:hypothetical protein